MGLPSIETPLLSEGEIHTVKDGDLGLSPCSL